MSTFKKLAEDRKKRAGELYAMEEDYEAFTPVCPDHPGVRRELLDSKQKKKLGLSVTEMAWKCPVDDKVYEAVGSIDQQTDGFSSMNQDTAIGASVAEEDGKFEDVDTIKADSERKIRE
jgi:hypothetical protein